MQIHKFTIGLAVFPYNNLNCQLVHAKTAFNMILDQDIYNFIYSEPNYTNLCIVANNHALQKYNLAVDAGSVALLDGIVSCSLLSLLGHTSGLLSFG